jgi:sialic acid synthase SpsE
MGSMASGLPKDIVQRLVEAEREPIRQLEVRKKNAGPDHPHSMEPQQFADMMVRIRDMEAALGSSRKEVVAEESETVVVQRRSLYASADIKKGEKVGVERIIELRPALGIYPKYKKQVGGLTAAKDIKKGEAIYWDSLA